MRLELGEPAPTTASASASESASREAGIFTKDVNVETINQSGEGLKVSRQTVYQIVSSGKVRYKFETPETLSLDNGATAYFTDDEPIIKVADPDGGHTDSFTFVNPELGTPRVDFYREGDGKTAEGSRTFKESDIVTWKSPTTGRTYIIKRNDDAEGLKHFTLTVK